MVKRNLTDEEKALWQLVTNQTNPLEKKEQAPPPPVPQARTPSKIRAQPPLTPSQAFALPELQRGEYAGIDAGTVERFRKGKTPIDATLDLHGLTQAKALAELEYFMKAQYSRGSRCLLVITGKGVQKDVQQGLGRGILREMLPQWLKSDALRPLVLAFDVAQPKHGGSGAYYILLRRKR